MSSETRKREITADGVGERTRNVPSWTLNTTAPPSKELLDRAHRGWERFLNSCEEPLHE